MDTGQGWTWDATFFWVPYVAQNSKKHIAFFKRKRTQCPTLDVDPNIGRQLVVFQFFYNILCFLYLMENKIFRTAASVSEALSSEGKIRRALAALQFRKLQEVMCILNISLNSQNLFLVENSVADPYLDPHGSAFKKSARIRIRMDRCGSGSRR